MAEVDARSEWRSNGDDENVGPAPRMVVSVVRLAAASLQVPAAFVGLTDDAWTISAMGGGEISTDDIVHLCSAIVEGGENLIVRDTLENAATEGLTLSFEGQPVRTFVGVPIRDEEGTIIGAFGLVDTQQRTFSENQILELEELASLAGALLTPKRHERTAFRTAERPPESVSSQPSFLVKLIDEIRAPLREVIGFSRLVSKEVFGEPRRRIKVIHKQSTRVLDTLRSTLDLIEIESGALRDKPEALELSRHVREVVERYRPQIREQALWLNVDSPDVPIIANLDKATFRRILDLVISNAVRFTRSGGISIRMRQAGSRAVIEICDTGIGVSEAFLARIFDPFSRERPDDADYSGGSGLGLTIAKGLVEASGGRIQVEPVENGGTKVTLAFSTSEINDKSGHAVVQSSTSIVRKDVSDRPVLLLVEDNPVTRRVIQRTLRGAYDVVGASDVDSAFARALEYDLDILLLDVALNERRTGVEVLHGIRSMPRYADVPAVVCTAYSWPGLRERYLDAGFNGYISKPFRKDQLLDVLQSTIDTGGETVQSALSLEELSIDLPPLPDTLPRILSLIAGEDDSMGADDLTHILQQDPVVTSWVLRKVNSAFHSVRGTVTSVDRAVTLLGAEPVANLVVAGLMTETFSSIESEAARRVYEEILETTLATAALSLELARALEMPNTEIVFTAGLMHDVGRLSLLSHDPDTYGGLWTEGDDISPPTIGQEMLHLGISHVAIGIEVSGEWDLPQALKSVIRHVEHAASAPPDYRTMVLVVAASRAAAHDLLHSPDEAGSTLLKQYLRELEKLHKRSASELLEAMQAKRDEVKSFAQGQEQD